MISLPVTWVGWETTCATTNTREKLKVDYRVFWSPAEPTNATVFVVSHAWFYCQATGWYGHHLKYQVPLVVLMPLVERHWPNIFIYIIYWYIIYTSYDVIWCYISYNISYIIYMIYIIYQYIYNKTRHVARHNK